MPAALDDTELTAALREITEPVAALGRRSAPMAVSHLVGWAVASHVVDPDAPLDAALHGALLATADVGGRAAVPGASRDVPGRPADAALPEPPAPVRDAAPLRQRVARLLPAIDHDLPTPTTKEEQR